MTISVTAETIVKPTEDETKVIRALHNVFPDTSVQRLTQEHHVKLRVSGSGFTFLATLRNLIKQAGIRSAARAILLRNTDDGRIEFYLHKQAAFAGRVSFCGQAGESPHGPISVEIRSDDSRPVIDYLAAVPSQAGLQRFQER